MSLKAGVRRETELRTSLNASRSPSREPESQGTRLSPWASGRGAAVRLVRVAGVQVQEERPAAVGAQPRHDDAVELLEPSALVEVLVKAAPEAESGAADAAADHSDRGAAGALHGLGQSGE